MKINKKVLFTALNLFTLFFFSASSTYAAIQSLNGRTGQNQTFANDTNVKITSAGTTHTLGWNGFLSPSRGGLGADASGWTTGSIPFFDGSVFAKTADLFWDAVSGLNIAKPITFNLTHPWDAIISSADQTTGDTKASDIVIKTGLSHGAANGSSIRVSASNGGTTSGGGGSITLEAGQGVGTDESNPFSSYGGGLVFSAGGAGITGNGGSIYFNTGAGGTTGGNGGDFNFTSGGASHGNPGNLRFTGGYADDSSYHGGNIYISSGGGVPDRGGDIGIVAQHHGNISISAQDGGDTSLFGANMNIVGSTINFSGPIMSQMDFRNPVNKFVSDTNSTVHIGADGFPGCIVMGDDDSSGVTYITANDGVLNVTTTKPSNCN